MERNKNTTIRWMDSLYRSKCGGCGDQIEEGDRIGYDIEERCAFCETCGLDVEEQQLARDQKKVSTELEDLEAKFED